MKDVWFYLLGVVAGICSYRFYRWHLGSAAMNEKPVIPQPAPERRCRAPQDADIDALREDRGEWVACSDLLPVYGEVPTTTVLGAWQLPSGGWVVDTVDYTGTDWRDHDSLKLVNPPTHWMPLPAAPRSEE